MPCSNRTGVPPTPLGPRRSTSSSIPLTVIRSPAPDSLPFDIRDSHPIGASSCHEAAAGRYARHGGRFALRLIVAPPFRRGGDCPARRRARRSQGLGPPRRTPLVGRPGRPYISGLDSTTRKEVILCLTTN